MNRKELIFPKYFSEKSKDIEKWFNIIAPEGKTITKLKDELNELRSKNWKEIL